MRSKQQPRPSYRWLNKGENDPPADDDIVDNTDNRPPHHRPQYHQHASSPHSPLNPNNNDHHDDEINDDDALEEAEEEEDATVSSRSRSASPSSSRNSPETAGTADASVDHRQHQQHQQQLHHERHESDEIQRRTPLDSDDANATNSAGCHNRSSTISRPRSHTTAHHQPASPNTPSTTTESVAHRPTPSPPHQATISATASPPIPPLSNHPQSRPPSSSSSSLSSIFHGVAAAAATTTTTTEEMDSVRDGGAACAKKPAGPHHQHSPQGPVHRPPPPSLGIGQHPSQQPLPPRQHAPQNQHHHRHLHRQQQHSLPYATPTAPSSFQQQLMDAVVGTAASRQNLIDSHVDDDVEHQIPVTFIPDHDRHHQQRRNHPHSASSPSGIVKRELASPRCPSRSSSASGRSPSADSNYSSHNSTSVPNQVTSPLGLSLPATMQPEAAAALLPPSAQSAAMAAYLGAAAVAAQQGRLLGLNANHLQSIAALGRGSSPPNMLPPLSSPMGSDSSVLDFSTKRKSISDDYDDPAGDAGDDVVNLSKSENSPLDLTVNRKRYNNASPPPQSRKVSRPQDYKPQQIVSPWTTPMTPYFAAAVAAASLSPKNSAINEWANKNKTHQQQLQQQQQQQHQQQQQQQQQMQQQHMQSSNNQNDATKALEKMSELSRLGGTDVGRQSNSSSNATGNSGGGRHSAWQSHWLNKGADSVKDVFKCVWCKLSFPTLESLTTHMKETQHMAGHGPHSNSNANSTSGQQQQTQQQINHQHNLHQTQKAANAAAQAAQNKADLNLMIKETMPLPRKLVRGQDVWLGKGAEQTRQILKCMWCGQSFRSLSDMTTHMQQTQHYTNIISQEQIISWKSSDDAKGAAGPGGAVAGGGSAAGGGASGAGSGPLGGGGGGGGSSQNNSSQNASNAAGSGTSSTVSAVLTCKVCDQAFTSLKDLSNHMVKNAHYKEHIMRSISESGGRRRQTKEKRKKSLPVRKLLELERAQQDFKNGDTGMKPMNKSMRDVGRITCDKCGDKIDAVTFVDHIRQCVGGDVNSIHRNIMNSDANTIIPPDSLGPLSLMGRDGRQSIGNESGTPNSRHISPNALSPASKDTSSTDTNSGPSVLNALEQLIEKSFDTRTRHGNNNAFAANAQQSSPLGSNILKRLGIDESVDYTKPLIDQQTMNFLRNYSQQQQNQHQHHPHINVSQYDRRERSGSESSSVSDRGSSRMNSLTPEQKTGSSPMDHHNHHHNHTQHQQHLLDRTTPRRVTPDHVPADSDSEETSIKLGSTVHQNIKKEPMDVDDDEPQKNASDLSSVHIKREHDLDDERPMSVKEEQDGEDRIKRRPSVMSSPAQSPRQPTPGGHLSTPMASPCSERSPTPRLSRNEAADKMLGGSQGSLGALSSMFDSLAGNSSTSTSTDQPSAQTGTARKGTFHPLAALQKLCDKTENTPQRQGSNSGSQALAATAQPSGSTASGAIMAFSWACNDAVMNDSVIKCKLCETPFSTKGAYRHHLSKVHFVNDEAMLESNQSLRNSEQTKASAGAGGKPSHSHHQLSPGSAHSPAKGHHESSSSLSSSSGSGATTSGNGGANNNNNNSQMSPPPPQSPQQQQQSAGTPNSNSSHQQQSSGSSSTAVFEESPHSKFLKYTELAKQLSSKYV